MQVNCTQGHLLAGQEESKQKASCNPVCPSRFRWMVTDAFGCRHRMSRLMPCTCLSGGHESDVLSRLLLVKLSVCRLVCLFICLLSVGLSACLPACLPVCLSVCLHTTHHRAATTTLNAQVGGARQLQICIHAFVCAVQSDQAAAYQQWLWCQSPQQLLQQPLLQPASLPLLLP